ncbi:SpoIIE family protein phosphatase [Streptomyces sp. NPDC051642]|uniref:SpoIIE family protein phosphatase n=1 Tax=Streptomyces sp. NPDC051642 TaxID=3154646 RepID=UPI003442DF6B
MSHLSPRPAGSAAVRTSQPGVTVTLCLVLVTPHDRHLHIAGAGHLPPLPIDPDRGPRLHHPHGPLLGMGLPHPQPTVVPARPAPACS